MIDIATFNSFLFYSVLERDLARQCYWAVMATMPKLSSTQETLDEIFYLNLVDRLPIINTDINKETAKDGVLYFVKGIVLHSTVLDQKKS